MEIMESGNLVTVQMSGGEWKIVLECMWSIANNTRLLANQRFALQMLEEIQEDTNIRFTDDGIQYNKDA